KFDVKASNDNGRDVVTVKISSPTEATPPKFGVFFRVSGAGVQNVWTSDIEKEKFQLAPQLWWKWATKYTSQLAQNTPIAVGFNSAGVSPVAIACSEAFNFLEYGLYVDDRTCEIVGRCEFFVQPVAPLKEYEVSVLLDRRGRNWVDTVKSCTEWVESKNSFTPAHVPESAYDPLYSTWYAYLQDVHDKELEKEAKLAAKLGMKTMILDDGWQKEDSKDFYSKAGDWMPVKSRFPDMKAHVAKVHEAGLKYMLWLAVPFMGNEAQNYNRFKKMFLSDSVLDPRFPEVREYLLKTYERAVGEWGFDGLKLDFIDCFALPAQDPAIKDNYAGRDYRSLPQAVDRLMKDVLQRLKKINPDVMIEFRQRYMGPAIRQYGNMIRAADTPADPYLNRRRICSLRLTSGKTAVHSDMLVWSKDETPQGAALPILNVLFSTIQYSMILQRVTPEHREVIQHWIKFSQEHRNALLKGDFTPHHPENGFSWVEGEDRKERIIACYAENACVKTGKPDKSVYLVNATGTSAMLVDFAAKPSKIEAFDVFGKSAGTLEAGEGLVRLPVPSSGYAKITW
ncbi:MAG: alpha-galactosidase, partial [Kiritimatiellae bacterium]|nr:alpha-galactosidase [Kiritimatiellia bacterium]